MFDTIYSTTNLYEEFTTERNGIGHTHARASSEQAWEPMASSRVHLCRKTRTGTLSTNCLLASRHREPTEGRHGRLKRRMVVRAARPPLQLIRPRVESCFRGNRQRQDAKCKSPMVHVDLGACKGLLTVCLDVKSFRCCMRRDGGHLC